MGHRKLKPGWSIEAAQDLMATHGIDAGDMFAGMKFYHQHRFGPDICPSSPPRYATINVVGVYSVENEGRALIASGDIQLPSSIPMYLLRVYNTKIYTTIFVVTDGTVYWTFDNTFAIDAEMQAGILYELREFARSDVFEEKESE